MAEGAAQEGVAKDLVRAGASAAFATIGSAPLDRIKTLLQLQPKLLQTGRLKQKYTGIFNCIRTIYRNEGLLGFWHGNWPNLLRRFAGPLVAFQSRDILRNRVFQSDPTKDSVKKMAVLNLLSGGLAGAVSLLAVQPLIYMHTRLTADALNRPQVSSRQFSGMRDLARQTINADGLPGLYRGYVVMAGSVFVYRALYFGVYDTMTNIKLGILSDNFASKFAMGWSAATLVAFLTYPLDTLAKRRMMTCCDLQKFRTSFHLLAFILRHEGVRSLYGGAWFSILRGLGGAVALVGWDEMNRIIMEQRQKKRELKNAS
eukprot:TRINITY_DN11637_c0_g1_i1.p1 TRINITY_DN11637_c0_g1~~TRINITY_DN11637_c0_g1_i1.p1  ORF type:complete len:324 (-),score=16.96 TRINITY_DN11637_c0_g1_i1:53-997(-)